MMVSSHLFIILLLLVSLLLLLSIVLGGDGFVRAELLVER